MADILEIEIHQRQNSAYHVLEMGEYLASVIQVGFHEYLVRYSLRWWWAPR